MRRPRDHRSQAVIAGSAGSFDKSWTCLNLIRRKTFWISCILLNSTNSVPNLQHGPCCIFIPIQLLNGNIKRFTSFRSSLNWQGPANGPCSCGGQVIMLASAFYLQHSKFFLSLQSIATIQLSHPIWDESNMHWTCRFRCTEFRCSDFRIYRI